MFTIPNPKEVLEAVELLTNSNELCKHLLEFQKCQFSKFWAPSGVLRSKEELNKILEAMDSDQLNPQSALFFSIGYELSQLILRLNPSALAPEEYLPKYEYTLNNGQIRII